MERINERNSSGGMLKVPRHLAFEGVTDVDLAKAFKEAKADVAEEQESEWQVLVGPMTQTNLKIREVQR